MIGPSLKARLLKARLLNTRLPNREHASNPAREEDRCATA